MWVETTIAMRFLRQGRAQTLLILFGIAVGVSVIVFVTALISGLQANIIERTLGTQAHVRVEAPDEVNRIAPAAPGTVQLVLEDQRAQALRTIVNWPQVRDVLDRLPDVPRYRRWCPAPRSAAAAKRWNRWRWSAWTCRATCA